ncbi:acetyl-CoA synthetase-like protein [Linderina pennispora]|uniref:Acetyl-CoA synthetase-like protein n=1 Tax=Linderina pennispora TaxID=61395 RepID=A0A1Y1W474_9FUNG|nr:acetyl-CoA synthetase-like protein [Linderina pennispora]ORX68218.1 acetyl-CoA synthetase-like protein [Linderina pennispora]
MIFKSIAPPVEIPTVDIPTYFLSAAKANGAKLDTKAFIDIGAQATLTYGQLDYMHNRIASGLVNDFGISKGDIVMIFATNCILYAPTYYGILAAGAVCCTASSAFNASELAYQLNDCKAKVVFTTKQQWLVISQAMDQGLVDIQPHNIIVYGESLPGYLYRSFRSVLSDKPYRRLSIKTKDEAASTPALIVYSSGTTGQPKGVVLSHLNMVSGSTSLNSLAAFLALKSGIKPGSAVQRYLVISPYAHIFGLATFLHNHVANAKTQYILPQYSIDAFLQAIARFKIQATTVVPSILTQIVKHPNLSKYDLSSLQYMACGAASVTKDTLEGVSRLLPASPSQGYGLTEVCGGFTLMSSYLPIAGSVGFHAPNCEVRFVDENGNELGADQEGELCVRGDRVMMGYLNLPEETARVIDGYGFFHTGDIGYINETGHIFITDRIKELIKYKGQQVSTAVKDAAVIGIDDPQRGTEVPMAYVVLDDIANRTDRGRAAMLCMEVQAFVAARVAGHKQLRGGVTTINAIPRNASGKILRRELKTRYLARTNAKL